MLREILICIGLFFLPFVAVGLGIRLAESIDDCHDYEEDEDYNGER